MFDSYTRHTHERVLGHPGKIYFSEIKGKMASNQTHFLANGVSSKKISRQINVIVSIHYCSGQNKNNNNLEVLKVIIRLL